MYYAYSKEAKCFGMMKGAKVHEPVKTPENLKYSGTNQMVDTIHFFSTQMQIAKKIW
jgi:hypothetical protein